MIHHTHRAGSISSSAILLSAIITSCGVIAAACIQAGWIAKPVAIADISPPPSPPIAQARFTGAIAPIPEQVASQSQFICTSPDRRAAAEPAGYFHISDEDQIELSARTGARSTVTDHRRVSPSAR